MNKYGVAKAADRTYCGVIYASKAEARYAHQLDLLLNARRIVSWQRAERVALVVNGTLVGHYRPDFTVKDHEGHYVHVEVKGQWTEAAKLRVRLFTACYPAAALRCVSYDGRGGFQTIETPRGKPFSASPRGTETTA